MYDGGGEGGVGVAGFDRVENALVLVAGVLHRFGVVNVFTQPEHSRQDLRLRGRVDDRSVSGRFENTNMKRVIGLVERSFAFALDYIAVVVDFDVRVPVLLRRDDHVGHFIADRGDLFLGGLAGRHGGDSRFDNFTNAVNFDQLVASDIADDGADLGDQFDKTLVGEPRSGFANRRRTDTDLFADRAVKQTRSRLEISRDQPIPQVLVGSDRVGFLRQDGFPKRMKTSVWARL